MNVGATMPPPVVLVAYVYECQRCGKEVTVRANVGNRRYGALHFCRWA